MRMKLSGVRGVHDGACSQIACATIGGFLVCGRLHTPTDPAGTVPFARSGGSPGPSGTNSVDAHPRKVAVAPTVKTAAASTAAPAPTLFERATEPTVAEARAGTEILGDAFTL